MRPTYETEEDRKKQREVADRLEKIWGCTLIKTPQFYQFDYTILQKNGVKAFAEIKCRDRWYQEMILSLHKWQAGLAAQRDTGLPFLVVYSVDGDIRWMKADGPMPVGMGGRTDRGDDQDVEPVVMISQSKLTKLIKEAA